MVLWKIPKSTVFLIFEELHQFYSNYLSDTEVCAKPVLEFSLSRTVSNQLPGCIGVLDGLAVRIRKPDRLTVRILRVPTIAKDISLFLSNTNAMQNIGLRLLLLSFQFLDTIQLHSPYLSSVEDSRKKSFIPGPELLPMMHIFATNVW